MSVFLVGTSSGDWNSSASEVVSEQNSSNPKAVSVSEWGDDKIHIVRNELVKVSRELSASRSNQGLLGNLLKHRILLIKSEGTSQKTPLGWESFIVKKTNVIAACVYRLWYSIRGRSFHYKTAQDEVKKSLNLLPQINLDIVNWGEELESDHSDTSISDDEIEDEYNEGSQVVQEKSVDVEEHVEVVEEQVVQEKSVDVEKDAEVEEDCTPPNIIEGKDVNREYPKIQSPSTQVIEQVGTEDEIESPLTPKKLNFGDSEGDILANTDTSVVKDKVDSMKGGTEEELQPEEESTGPMPISPHFKGLVKHFEEISTPTKKTFTPPVTSVDLRKSLETLEAWEKEDAEFDKIDEELGLK